MYHDDPLLSRQGVGPDLTAGAAKCLIKSASDVRKPLNVVFPPQRMFPKCSHYQISGP